MIFLVLVILVIHVMRGCLWNVFNWPYGWIMAPFILLGWFHFFLLVSPPLGLFSLWLVAYLPLAYFKAIWETNLMNDYDYARQLLYKKNYVCSLDSKKIKHNIYIWYMCFTGLRYSLNHTIKFALRISLHILHVVFV